MSRVLVLVLAEVPEWLQWRAALGPVQRGVVLQDVDHQLADGPDLPVGSWEQSENGYRGNCLLPLPEQPRTEPEP